MIYLGFDLSWDGWLCLCLTDKDDVVDEAEAGGEDVIEAADNENDEAGDKELADMIFEAEAAQYRPDDHPGQ